MSFNPGFADVVDRFESTIRSKLSKQAHRVLNHIQACRTPQMGGRLLHCDTCQKDYVQYHSCRDRHCPTCGYQASQHWMDARMADVLPVTYHHLVFTLPHELNPWVTRYRDVIYRLLFKAVWSTLNSFGQDPKRLSGQLGATLMLHTWGQTLGRHVHMHCLVPGGVLQTDDRWRAATSTYLFPVQALSRYYRGKMVALLRQSRDEFDQFNDDHFDQVLNELMAKEWVVYSKPVLTRTNTVVEYLARYTKRIGISNARLLRMDTSHVWFRYKNYRQDGEQQIMKLKGEELLRRFLLHLLPKGFMRVRYYGYLANMHRRKKLAVIRHAMTAPVTKDEAKSVEPARTNYLPICMVCKQIMSMITEIPPTYRSHQKYRTVCQDSC